MYSKNDYRYYLENQLMHSDDFLAHYGVQGMHWGIRRYQPYSQVPRKSGKKGIEKKLANKKSKQIENKKDKAQQKAIKQKAKNYQKQLNDLDSMLGASVAGYASESRRFDIYDDRVNRQTFKGKDSSKSKTKRDNVSGRAKEYENAYRKGMKETNALLKKISKDKDLVYNVSATPMTGNVLGARSKSTKQLNKSMKEKYGRRNILDTDYYQYSTGNRYIVKPATDKRLKKYRYTQHDRYAYTPTHTETHYY